MLPTPISFWALRVYHNVVYRNFYALCMAALCMLAWWEPPWLPEEPRAAEGGLAALRGADLALLLLALFDVLLQWAYHGTSGAFRRGWLQAKTVLLVALFANWGAAVAVGAPYWLRAVRPLFFVERLRNVRKVVGNVIRSGAAILNVGLLLMVHLTFFAVLGVVLFAGIDGESCDRLQRPDLDPPWDRLGCTTFADNDNPGEPGPCDAFFFSLPEAFIQLFAMLAGSANFPAVMVPVYKCSKTNALFFVAFIVSGVYLLITMLLAVAAAAFSKQTEEEVVLKYARTLGGLDVAFAELCGADTMAVAAAAQERSTRANMLKLASAGPPPPPAKLSDLVAFFRHVNPWVPAEVVLRLAAVVEPGCAASQTICREAFNLLMVNFSRLRVKAGEAEGAPAPSLPSGLEALLPPAEPPSGACAKLLRCFGREALAREAPPSALQAANEDAEWFDGTAVARFSRRPSFRGSLSGAGAGAPSAGSAAAAWAKAIANPLAGATAALGAADAADGAAVEAAVDGADASAPVLSPALSSEEAVAAWGSSSPGRGSPPGGSPRAGAGGAVPPRANCCVMLRDGALNAFSSIPSSVPELSASSHPARLFAARLLAHPLATFVFDAAIAVNCAVQLWALSGAENVLDDAVSPLEAALLNVELGMLGIFVAELALKTIVWGPLSFLRSSLLHRIDALILIAAIGTGAAFHAGDRVNRSPSRIYSLIILFARSLRLLRYFGALPGFNATVAAVVDVVPMLWRYSAVVCGAFYFFTIVALELFHGRLNPEKWSQVGKSSYGKTDIKAFDFDSFPNALVTLFYVMVLNDWPIIMEGLVFSFDNLWPRLYFVVFIIIMVAFVCVKRVKGPVDGPLFPFYRLQAPPPPSHAQAHPHTYTILCAG